MEKFEYEDIINMPHHVSNKRVHMSVYDRAAQFSPFAALTGYDSAVKEEARYTEERICLDEEQKNVLDYKLNMIMDGEAGNAEASITYFVPDMTKQGGSYRTVVGQIDKVDRLSKNIILKTGEIIPIKEIISFD